MNKIKLKKILRPIRKSKNSEEKEEVLEALGVRKTIIVDHKTIDQI